jgi:hypothetical protein
VTLEERAATSTNGIVELGCGHRIRVARDDGSLVVMAHLVRHRTLCPGRSAPPAPELRLAFPLPFLPGGASR